MSAVELVSETSTEPMQLLSEYDYADAPIGTLAQFNPCPLDGCNCGEDYAMKIAPSEWAATFPGANRVTLVSDFFMARRVFGATVIA